MVQIGDKIRTKYGIGQVGNIIMRKDGRYIIMANYTIELPTIEGDDKFEVVNE